MGGNLAYLSFVRVDLKLQFSLLLQQTLHTNFYEPARFFAFLEKISMWYGKGRFEEKNLIMCNNVV